MRTFLRIVFIVVVAAVIIGTGIAIFNAGMAQGAAMSGQLSDGAPARDSVLRAVSIDRGASGFSAGFLCFGIFGLFLLFGLGRLAFGPRHGWHRGPWGMGGRAASTAIKFRRASRSCTAACTRR